MLRSLLSAILATTLLVTPAIAKDRSELASKLRTSTRQLTLWSAGEIAGYCTAFSINDAKDYFATAAHCVKGADYINIGGWNAYVIFVNYDADLAVAVVPDSGDIPALHLATEVRQGEEIFNYGYGYAFPEPMFRAGYVSIVDAVLIPKGNVELLVGVNEHFTLADFAIIPGQSGGPIVDARGDLVTMNQISRENVVGAGRVLSEITALMGKYFEK